MTESVADCSSSSEKPCLVSARQGFSVLYKNRSLYSRYEPQKAAVRAVQSLVSQTADTSSSFKILSGTLVLCLSPCLWYGLDELEKSLSENSFIIGIEYDKNLYELAKESLAKICSSKTRAVSKTEDEAAVPSNRVLLLPYDEIKYLSSLLSIPNFKTPSGFSIPNPGSFRRVRAVSFSAGTQFNPELYKQISFASEQIVSQFWKNRLTLVKLGRLFARNLFRNLSHIPSSVSFDSVAHSVSKPIIVVGAGESAEQLINFFSNAEKKIARESFYILAVDASLPFLKSINITPDGIVAVESQSAIEQAYVGTFPVHSMIFADMTSRPSVLANASESVCMFSSEYTESSFYKRLDKQNLLPKKIPPLGSVGLTAVYIALLLRSTDDVQLFTYGLDFSFTLGTTHVRGTPAILSRLRTCTRVTPILNYNSAFRIGAKFISQTRITDTALEGYAISFSQTFSGIKNLYNLCNDGLPLGIPNCTNDDVINAAKIYETNSNNISKINKKQNELKCTTDDINNFYDNEEKALNRIKELLINGTKAKKISDTHDGNKTEKMTQEDVRKELNNLLSEREYLYLHFPDGYKCDVSNLSFLKRVRAEIDFFLKDIKYGKSLVFFF